MEQLLTFDQLPNAVIMLTKEVSELKKLLLEKSELQPIDQPEQLLTIQEAAKFMNLTVPTMYSKVSRGELPVMKRSKRLYFSSIELLEYLKKGHKKSNADIEAEAEAYLKKKGANND